MAAASESVKQAEQGRSECQGVSLTVFEQSEIIKSSENTFLFTYCLILFVHVDQCEDLLLASLQKNGKEFSFVFFS